MSIEMSSTTRIPSFSCIQNGSVEDFSEFQVEQEVSSLFRKTKHWTFKKNIELVAHVFRDELRQRPWTTLAKSCVAFVGLSAIYPAMIGSWACLKTFTITPLRKLESSDLEVAMAASQNIGNTGMAITYIVQLYEFVFHPITQLFVKTYNKKICEEIKEYYRKVLRENTLSPKKIQHLILRENEELGLYNGLPVASKVNVDAVQSRIDNRLEKNLSFRNVICLTAHQIKDDIYSASYNTVAKKIVTAVVTLGLLGFCNTVLSLGTYGCYKPFDLQSPYDLASNDSRKVESAVANYANVGHGLEYIVTMGILSRKAFSILIGRQYQKVMNREIEKTYQPHIEDLTLSVEARDLLYQRMRFELSKK